jgi:L-ascorbate oxidase
VRASLHFDQTDRSEQTRRSVMPHRSCTALLTRRTLARRTLALATLAAACAIASALAADGTPAEPPADRVVSDPILAPMQRDRPTTALRTLQAARIEPGGSPDKDPLLNIRLTDGRIYNPATRRFDDVRLRSYVAEGATPHPYTPFVAPTLQAKPGETIRVGLNNQLEREPNCKPPNINTPHCFNSTNLHSHGLWVSPSGNSDNVLITIRPKVSFEYEYNIPATHPAGTFWYHPHLHGSTALQVSSGMAGALIVHGDRPPTPSRNGDVDTLLRDEAGAAYKERLVLFQQVQYACRDAQGRVKTRMVKDPNNPTVPKVVDWVCAPGDVGGIEGYTGTAVNVDAGGGVPVGTTRTGYGLFGPSSWTESNRYTSINGQIMPRFADAVAGRVERWRNIHAGVRDTIKLQFVAMRSSAKPASLRSPADHDRWIAQNCVGTPLPQFEIASDGLTHAQAIQRAQTVLQPGYRSDLLMVFPAAGTYCVIDGSIPASGSVSGDAESRRLLGTVSVAPGTPVGNDPATYLTRVLTRSAIRWMPDDVKQKVVVDLERGLGLQSFVPHRTITTTELTPVSEPCTTDPNKPANSAQCVTFSIGGTPVQFMVNGQPYDPKTARTLILNNVEEWELASTAGSHPFHIHVNPFQVARILDADGKDVSVPGSGDPDYAATQGTWKDTLFVKSGYTLFVRTRYQRYIGEYVLHCHILDHEDQGMMQNVRVVLPDGEGGAVGSGHH